MLELGQPVLGDAQDLMIDRVIRFESLGVGRKVRGHGEIGGHVGL